MNRVIWSLAISGLMIGAGPVSVRAQTGGNDAAGQTGTSQQRGQLNAQDENFVIKAARIDMEEVEAGKLAQQKGASQVVRSFGEHMINDHSKANTGLKEIAAQKSAGLPTQLSQKQESTLQKLDGLSGESFDRAFAEAMVKGHTQAVAEFEKAAKNLSDPDLRAWAETALPLLQEHLRMAKNMEAAVNNQK